ncbi:MAG: sulfite exporter TauE/SafE family protein [Bacteroidetes bacterium]|nr:sulfite exporter TauE/SafE family protein [Bacteroidota bacterium]
MSLSFIIAAFVLFFVIAALYSSIGHAGASGYLAIMALLSFASESIKPTSLVLNIIVAAIASYRFISQGYFDKRIFLAFVVFSVPASFVGGLIILPAFYFKMFAGIFLIVSAFFLLIKKQKTNEETKEVKNLWLMSAIFGTIIGFVSGIIGVGGGIFLTPLILMFGWTRVKNVSGISALFILLNSISGLLGHLSSIQKVDTNIFYWVGAVIGGGFLGSYLGSKKFNNRVIIYCLFIVLLSAGLKFIFVDTLK